MKKLSLFLILMTFPFLLTEPSQSSDKLTKATDDYCYLRARAVKENKLLFVWVKSIPRRFPGCIHWETDEDAHFGVTGPGLVVGVPFKGDLYALYFSYSITKAEVDNEVKSSIEKWSKVTQLSDSVEPSRGQFCPT